MVTDATVPADIAFLGKDPGEHCQFYFRQHWIRMLWPLVRASIWSLFVIVALWLFVGYFTVEHTGIRHTALLFLAATWIFAHIVFLTAVYRHFLYVIVVTNQRIHRIKRTLITHDDHQTIDLRMLQEIHKSQHGPIQNLLGFGTLVFEAQETILKIHFIPRVGEKYERILHIKEKERLRAAREGNTAFS